MAAWGGVGRRVAVAGRGVWLGVGCGWAWGVACGGVVELDGEIGVGGGCGVGVFARGRVGVWRAGWCGGGLLLTALS